MFQNPTLDAEGRFLYPFRLPPETPPARFRAGDFLRLNALGSPDLQSGVAVILAHYEPHAHRLAVMARQGRPPLSKGIRYTLDEDIEDWRSEEHTSELQSRPHLVCRLLLEKKTQ